MRIVQVRYAAAKDVADKVNQIFQAQGGAGRRGARLAAGAAPAPGRAPAPAPRRPRRGGARRRGARSRSRKILPDERTNKLIVIADEKSFQRILELIEQLDVPDRAATAASTSSS